MSDLNLPIWKDIFREIKKSLPRFISIWAIICMGVAFFIGIKASGPSMIQTTQTYYAQNHLPHGKVLGTQGLDNADIDKLKELSLDWLPLKSVYTEVEQENIRAKIYPLQSNEKHNFFKLVQGRLPQNNQEIAIDADAILKFPHLTLGKQLTFSNQDRDEQIQNLIPHLKNKHLKIVGYVESPVYYERNQRSHEGIDFFAITLPSNISGELFTEAFFWDNQLNNQNSFTQSWERQLNQYSKLIDQKLDIQGQERLKKIKQQAIDSIEEGQKEINQGYKKLADSKAELEEASQELVDGQEKINKGQEKLNQGRLTYQEGLSQYQEGYSNYQREWTAFQEKVTTFDQAKSDYEQGQKMIHGGFDDLLSDLKSKSDNINEGLVALQAEEAKLTQQKTSLYYQIKLLNNQISQLTSTPIAYREIQQVLSAKQIQLETLKQTFTNQQEKLAKLSNVTDVQNRLTSLEEQANQLATQIAERESKLIGENSEVIATDTKLLNLKENYQTVQNQIQEENNKLQSISQLQTSANNLQQDISNLSQEISSIESYLANHGTDLENLMKQEDKLSTGMSQIEKQRNDLESKHKQIKQEIVKIQQQKVNLPMELKQVQKLLDEQEPMIQAGKEKFAQSKLKLNQSKAQLDQSRKKLDAGYNQLEQSKKEWQAGLSTYQEGLKEYKIESKKARKELKDAEEKLIASRNELKDLLTPEYIVKLTQDDSVYQSVKNNAKQLNVISNIFPVFFLGIAILVSYTTIKRMTTEQRNYMGTLKQMGYHNHVILSKFVIYAGFAAILGVVSGIWLGYQIFPPVVLGAYNTMYLMDQPETKVSLFWNCVISVIAIATVMIPAIASPLAYLKESPAQLLRPPAPRSGNIIWLEKIKFIWQHLDFKRKMTMRNLMRYKMRNLMTLFGIAGCTMLIVTGFGISHTINGILDYQFGEVQKIDNFVLLEDNLNPTEIQKIQNQLVHNPSIEAAIPIYQRTIQTQIKGIQNQDVTVVVPMGDEQTFEQYINLSVRKSEDRIKLSKNNILMTERLAEIVHFDKNMELPIQADTLVTELPITNVVENYIGHYMYLSPQAYEKYFLETPIVNQFYIKMKDQPLEQIQEIASSIDGIQANVNLHDLAAGIKSSLSSLDLITLVLIVSAASLAFVVLYNLTNINIEERLKELATIKVLGFYSREVSLYIYDEILVLTGIGSLLGCWLGWGLTHFLMKTMQLNNVLFYPRIHITGYIISIILTFIFSAAVMIIMHRKIRVINMVEALKAIE